jgi:NAD-dependent dihydropyrimidine dehydrogenase PreA subunit
MAVREVIRIDEEKCDGCGKCVPSCVEGALAIVNGKARLVSEVYCDGLGACLGHCPQGAISVEKRDAPDFDKIQVHAHLARLKGARTAAPSLAVVEPPHHQCPGSMSRSLGRRPGVPAVASDPAAPAMQSELINWPVQLMLVSPGAPYLRHADILLVADCVPFAYPDFHRRFLRGKPVIIGCPKLDQVQLYARKLVEIIRGAEPRSLTVIHMEVPCCSGLTKLAEYAITEAGSALAVEDVTISVQGVVIAEETIAVA